MSSREDGQGTGADWEHVIITQDEELRRLDEGFASGTQSTLAFLDRIVARCPGNAEIVLSRCREVLVAVIRNTRVPWPALEAWQAILPEWFTGQCREELEGEQPRTVRDEAWRIFERDKSIKSVVPFLREHRQDFDQLKAEEEEHRHDPWTLSAWISWFQPEEREWWWWGASIPDPDTLSITVEVTECQYPAEALFWLLRASGATSAAKEL